MRNSNVNRMHVGNSCRSDACCADSERSVWAVVDVGLHLGDVVDPLAKSRQVWRLKLHLKDFLGPLQFHWILDHYCTSRFFGQDTDAHLL